MELGLTFPLQRFLKGKAPAYGTEPDRRFCWDLHVIDLRGRKCLLAVHCHSRYTFVRYDVAPVAWADVLKMDLCLDTDSQAQPLLDHAVNTCPSRCAGVDGLGLGLERIALSL